MGVGNELGQCIDEGLKLKLNSCFAREDLGSNRLGTEFGKLVKIARSEARKTPVHMQLQTFLARLSPQPPKLIADTQLPSSGNVALEAAEAIVLGILDILVPPAY